jgi:hypothetical protein
MLVGGIMIFIPFLVPLATFSQGTISIERVDASSYVAHLTGGEPGTQYNLEYTLLLTVNPTWTYAGVFLTDSSGSLSTFDFNLPSTEYPITFRFVHAENNTATYNTVTIDPNNPPPINDEQGETQAISYLTVLGVGTVLIGAVVTAFQSKKLKLSH